MDSRYEAGVGACAEYLSNLPDRARNMWVDAAYEVWVSERLAKPRDTVPLGALVPSEREKESSRV
jgi:hypothetical protein